MKEMGQDFRARLEAGKDDQDDADFWAHFGHFCDARCNEATPSAVKATDPRIARYTDSIGRGTR